MGIWVYTSPLLIMLMKIGENDFVDLSMGADMTPEVDVVRMDENKQHGRLHWW